MDSLVAAEENTYVYPHTSYFLFHVELYVSCLMLRLLMHTLVVTPHQML